MTPAPICLANDVKSYLLDEELLIFSKNQQRLFHLNTVAAFIWCCLEEKLDSDHIVQLLIETFGISSDQANTDLNHILVEWTSSGLLISAQNKDPDVLPAIVSSNKPVEYQLSKPVQSHFISPRYYQLIDTTFQVRFTDESIEKIVHPLLAHLETHPVSEHAIQLDVVKNDQDYVLLTDDKIIDYCSDIQTLTPMMHANVLMLAYDRVDCLLAIHAGAVSKGEQCILLPAISGSGKSTLTAALLTEDYGYCTDDLVLLSHENFQIRSVPVSLGVKEGAWPILASRYPIINQLPTFIRLDDKVVRYLPPPKKALSTNNNQSYSVKHIIFPKYQADAQLSLTPLSTADSLCRLTEAGYDVGGHLEVSHVDDLIQWISNINCYSLEYDSLTDAISEIKKLF